VHSANVIRTYDQHKSIDLLDLTVTSQHKKLEIYAEKASRHGHNKQFPFKHRTKNGSLYISPYQNALFCTRSKQKTKGMEDNTNNRKKPQLLKNSTNGYSRKQTKPLIRKTTKSGPLSPIITQKGQSPICSRTPMQTCHSEPPQRHSNI